MTGSVLFYVQHLLGIGHLRRALRLVAAIEAEGLAVTLVAGGEEVPELATAGANRIVQLPPIRSRDAGFHDLVDAAGEPVGEALRAARQAALLDALAAADPDAVVLEAYPFGRRAFGFELDPLIAAARGRRQRPLLYSSIRDILVAPAGAARRRATVARVRADFDTVLVHGDPQLIRLEDSFPEACDLADLLVYTGYVYEPPDAAADDGAGTGEVLVSAGGGAVGGALLAAALAARRGGCLADRSWRLLTGPNLPAAEFAALAADLPSGVVLERYRADFPRLLRRCHVSVSQAGYNTVLDILAAGARAVVVPFAAGRESEQSLRAERLARRGVLTVVGEAALTPQLLAQAIEMAAARPPRPLAIDIDGARRTARLLAERMAEPGRAGIPQGGKRGYD
jgi:predicted glycosyltransferase